MNWIGREHRPDVEHTRRRRVRAYGVACTAGIAYGVAYTAVDAYIPKPLISQQNRIHALGTASRVRECPCERQGATTRGLIPRANGEIAGLSRLPDCEASESAQRLSHLSVSLSENSLSVPIGSYAVIQRANSMSCTCLDMQEIQVPNESLTILETMRQWAQ